MKASGVRRILAVFIDFFVFFAAWAVVGALITAGSFYYALGVFLIVDVALTAFLGASVGRWITGIRVVRVTGGRPGLGRALLRTTVVLVSGWAGLLLLSWLLWLRRLLDSDRPIPDRMWWDAAAGTHLVRAV